MTIQEVKGWIAHEQGYNNWENLVKANVKRPNYINKMVNSVIKTFAAHKIEEQIKLTADEALGSQNGIYSAFTRVNLD